MMGYLRPFIVPVLIVGIIIYELLTHKKLTVKNLFLITTTVSLIMISSVYIFNEYLLRSINIFDLFEYRLANKISEFNRNMDISFTKLFLSSIFSFVVPPMNLTDFGTPWTTSESLLSFSRSYNSFLSIFMFIGILYPLNKTKEWLTFIVMLFSIYIGMTLLGQTLSDRMKLIQYPFVFYFIAKGFERLKKCNDINCYLIICTLSTLILIIQIIFMNTRYSSYGF